MKKSHKQSRREFLTDSAKLSLFAWSLNTVWDSLFMNRAFAQTASRDFTHFLHLNLFGSPPRWIYDLILNPYNEASFIGSPMIRNVYSVGTGTEANRYTAANQYRLVQSPYKLNSADPNGAFVPYLLSLDIPKAGGGSRKAWELLAQMIQVRGIDVLNQAHPQASMFHQAAVPGYQTLSAVTADNSTLSASNVTKNLIRATSLNPNDNSIFKSTKGYATYRYQVSAGGNNLLNMFQSLQPIKNLIKTGNFTTNQDALKYQIEDALKALAPGNGQYYSSVLDSSSSATKILTDQAVTVFDSLLDNWTALFTKYKSLVSPLIGKNATLQYPLINDKPIGRADPVTSANNDELVKYQYSTDLFTQNQDASNAVDLRLMLANANADQLAAQFAVCEFLLTTGICPSVSLVVAPLANVALQMGTSKSNRGMIFDQHFTGVMPSIFQNSLFYLAFTACVLELIDQLKNKGLFNNTLIYMNSEFNRSPRLKGSGADHGGHAAHVNLISGKIDRFQLVGNIWADATLHGYSAEYKGSWGVGAPFANAPALDIIQFWGSVMKLLGAPQIPSAVTTTLFSVNSAGKIVVSSPYSEKPKIKTG